ncbi:hypothetical protein NAPIS_ORF01666 [Vairimorpha apis BRL 01]|uniref:Reverse transcriptase domain-containing protein n=1 Tax=Vairimorpha apis BRL 01 TaxID=1037528 RepID=T0MC53_9MICR|nr:hypothetical protein NAPIS_ORF01666 [Vairimorpha apis BRL 01]
MYKNNIFLYSNKPKLMVSETKEFFRKVGLEMNINKSSTNYVICEDDAKLLEVVENLKNTIENCKVYRVPLNEYAISLINNFVGISIDDGISSILIENHVHQQNACKERLYLPRNKLGRGLNSVELKCERMLFQFNNTLRSNQEIFLRRKALKNKYNIEEPLSIKLLDEAQKTSLNLQLGISMETCNLERKEHFVYCRTGISFYKKELNVLIVETNTSQRHNEALRCIHLQLCIYYGLTKSKKIRNHSLQECTIPTGIKLKFDNLRTVETEKKHKYDLIVNHCGSMNEITTTFHKKYRSELNIDSRTQAYIQARVLKMTLECILMEALRGEHITEEEQNKLSAFEHKFKLYDNLQVITQKISVVEKLSNIDKISLNMFRKLKTFFSKYSDIYKLIDLKYLKLVIYLWIKCEKLLKKFDAIDSVKIQARNPDEANTLQKMNIRLMRNKILNHILANTTYFKHSILKKTMESITLDYKIGYEESSSGIGNIESM